MHTHTHTIFRYFSKANWVSQLRLYFLRLFQFPRLCIIMGQTQIYYILLDTVLLNFPWTTRQSNFVKLHCYTALSPSLHHPNHLYPPFLAAELSDGFSPNRSVISVFLFLSFGLKPYMRMSILQSCLTTSLAKSCCHVSHCSSYNH